MNHDAFPDDLPAYVDSTLLCPLSRCILEGNTDALERLLRERTKNPTPMQADSRGWTALHVAAFKDEHADCLKLLLRYKDTLGLNLDAKTIKGKTALYLACSKGCVKNCNILLEGQCNAGIPEGNGYTPLHIASIRGHAGIVSQLIAHGLNPNCLDSYRKYTPLHYACTMGSLEVVRELMRSKQIKLDMGRYDALASPLDEACEKGSLEIVRILVEADPSLVNWTDYWTYTPLIRAIQSRNVECVKYLLDRRAEANYCTRDGKTVLHFALEMGVKEILELILQATGMKYIHEHFRRGMRGLFSFTHQKSICQEVNSLISSAIYSYSPECMLLLLESRIPKGILETPVGYRRYDADVCDAHSPIAYLFREAVFNGRADTRVKFDEFLRLLLEHNITHLYEFWKMMEFKAPHTETVHYMHPFIYIFIGPWSSMQRDGYLNMLIEYGITADYCLQCDVHYNSRFQDFDVNVLKRFYKPVEWALIEDKAEFVELLLVNSAILEPSHLWNFLQYRRRLYQCPFKMQSPRNVVKYLIDLGVVVDTSNPPLYPFAGRIECPNLQQLCRHTIRKHLRDVTIQDNLKNFKQKINALPLPNSLKAYLQFRRR